MARLLAQQPRQLATRGRCRYGEAVYDANMTTERDHGNYEQEMLRCELRDSHLYPSLELALRDMRQANGRDPMTGAGDGNESWIGLSMAMIVLGHPVR